MQPQKHKDFLMRYGNNEHPVQSAQHTFSLTILMNECKQWHEINDK